jgi:hypothetical protein
MNVLGIGHADLGEIVGDAGGKNQEVVGDHAVVRVQLAGRTVKADDGGIDEVVVVVDCSIQVAVGGQELQIDDADLPQAAVEAGGIHVPLVDQHHVEIGIVLFGMVGDGHAGGAGAHDHQARPLGLGQIDVVGGGCRCRLAVRFGVCTTCDAGRESCRSGQDGPTPHFQEITSAVIFHFLIAPHLFIVAVECQRLVLSTLAGKRAG